MAYRSTDHTRKKKDAKRSALLKAAAGVFAEKGYQSATVRDIVAEAGVAIGTFYFYFPDKETLFVHLYEETAGFLLSSLKQSIERRENLARKIASAIQTYINVALFEPTVVNLLLTGGVSAIPTLARTRDDYRQKLIGLWKKALDRALNDGVIAAQNTRRGAEMLTGAIDEVVINLLASPNPNAAAEAAARDATAFAIRALAIRSQAAQSG